MKIAVLSNGYPSPENKYNSGFVHRRVINYTPDVEKIQVFAPNNSDRNYVYDDIYVNTYGFEKTKLKINQFAPDVIFVHAPVRDGRKKGYFDIIESFRGDIPIVNWIHVYEALLVPYFYPNKISPSGSVLETLQSVKDEFTRAGLNLMQLQEMRKHLKKTDDVGDIVVFVSQWLKRAVEKSVLYSPKNTRIIPNPIDEYLFKYNERNKNNKNKILSIRSFSSKKYANDLSIKAMAQTKNAKLDLYGKGAFLDRYRKLAHKLGANVEFHPEFLEQSEIAELHQQYGMYLSPSRLDSQGVSMCEAMASGLPVITSPVGGIPEFVDDGETGFLCETPEEMANKIQYLQGNPDEMISMGENAAQAIRQKAASGKVAKDELEVAKNLL